MEIDRCDLEICRPVFVAIAMAVSLGVLLWCTLHTVWMWLIGGWIASELWFFCFSVSHNIIYVYM